MDLFRYTVFFLAKNYRQNDITKTRSATGTIALSIFPFLLLRWCYIASSWGAKILAFDAFSVK